MDWPLLRWTTIHYCSRSTVHILHLYTSGSNAPGKFFYSPRISGYSGILRWMFHWHVWQTHRIPVESSADDALVQALSATSMELMARSGESGWNCLKRRRWEAIESQMLDTILMIPVMVMCHKPKCNWQGPKLEEHLSYQFLSKKQKWLADVKPPGRLYTWNFAEIV